MSLSQKPFAVTKISEGINFDGVPDEELWINVPSLQMTMHTPVFGNKPTDSSLIKTAYDDEYLYISGILNLKDPSSLHANGKKRDYAVPTSDYFGVILDTFFDRENALAFWTNPNGLRTDGTVKNNLADSNADISFSWNTFWDVRTKVNEDGWTVEMRIPFSSLRFQVKDGITNMGIIITRYDADKPEVDTYPAITTDFNSAFWKPSLGAKISFSGLRPEKPVYFAPYLTTGLSQQYELNEANTSYEQKSTPKFDAGLDAKYSLTNNLTMDLTLNTDFAQVEADDEKINLTRFSLFFPEKRTFFLEKSDVFDFSFVGGNNLFYSRRIGIYDGHPVRIYGGARLTGRVEKWDIGILDMQTASYDLNPGENFGVFRTKRTLFNENSYIGGMFTSRLGMNGAYNLAYGIDGQFRVKGDEYLTVRFAQTAENDSAYSFVDKSPSRLLLQWERRNQKGFSYDFLYTYSGTRFNPGIGFEMFDNYQGVRGILNYGWFPSEENIIRYHKVSFLGYNLWSTLTGKQETFAGQLSWTMDAKSGFSAIAAGIWNMEDLADTLTMGNDQALVYPGRYKFANANITYNTSASNVLYASFMADAGRFYDGFKFSFSAMPNISIGGEFDLGLTYSLDYVNFSSRNMQFFNHIIGVKGLLTITTQTSFSSFIQYNTSVDKFSANIRFRYNPREGNDFYIVYNEGLNTNLRREFPALTRSSGRTILLKYTYTFRF